MMQNRKIVRALTLSLLALTCVLSCRKSNPSWDVDMLTPLVRSTLTINNLLPDSIIHVNADNSLDIIYSTSLSSFSTQNIFTLPNYAFDTLYKAPVVLALLGGSAVTNTSIQNVGAMSGSVELSRGIMRSGYMSISVISSLKGKLGFTFNVPSLSGASGGTFQTIVTIPAATASSTGNFSGVFDLSGYQVDFTGPNGTLVNTLLVDYALTIDASEDTVHIAVGDSVLLSYSFIDLIPAYAKGYFGDTITTASDSSGFALFKHLTTGTVDFENIDVSLSIENGVGADARITMNQLVSSNSKSGNKVQLAHSIMGSPVNITRSLDNNGTVVPSIYNIALTNTNSNIKQFVENLPDSLKFKLKYEINPMGNVSGSNDFGYHDKLMDTKLNMRIPLSVIANDLTLADTLDLNLSADADNINEGTLYLQADNGFPFTAQAQLYLMDNILQTTDSLINEPNTILAPPLNANFICNGTARTTLAIPITSDKLSNLRSAKKILIKVKFNTSAQPNYVKIYSTYKMDVKVVGDLNCTTGKK